MLPKRRRRLWIIMFLLVLCLFCLKTDIVITMYKLVVFYAPCDDTDSRQLLEEMCKKYENGKITGNLCHDICGSRKIKYETCANHRGGKLVFFMECQNACAKGKTIPSVLKTINVNASMASGTSTSKIFSNVSKLWYSFIKARLWDKLRRNITKKDVFNLFFDKTDVSLKSYAATLSSQWRLAQQDEYIFMKSHQHVHYYPKIYGTCGSFYLTEHAPPYLSYFPSILKNKESDACWKKRAFVAIDILKIAESMDHYFHEKMHFCDVKMWNYGISETGRVKIIDTDSIYYESNLIENMARRNCTRHEDCDFNDCHGFCNFAVGKCLPKRTNNNIQKICQDIFANEPKNYYGGLLHQPPSGMADIINGLVWDCANPDGSNGMFSSTRRPTPTVFYKKLTEALIQSTMVCN